MDLKTFDNNMGELVSPVGHKRCIGCHLAMESGGSVWGPTRERRERKKIESWCVSPTSHWHKPAKPRHPRGPGASEVPAFCCFERLCWSIEQHSHTVSTSEVSPPGPTSSGMFPWGSHHPGLPWPARRPELALWNRKDGWDTNRTGTAPPQGSWWRNMMWGWQQGLNPRPSREAAAGAEGLQAGSSLASQQRSTPRCWARLVDDNLILERTLSIYSHLCWTLILSAFLGQFLLLFGNFNFFSFSPPLAFLSCW